MRIALPSRPFSQRQLVSVAVSLAIVTDAVKLDGFIGFPNRDSLVGATVAGKDRVVWVEKQRGVVNLWAADEADDWKPRMLTNNTADDGTDGFDFLEFAANNQTLLFSSRVAADANPNHLTSPPVVATYVVPFAAGITIRLVNTSASALSRAGDGFLYVLPDGRPGASSSAWQRDVVDPSGVAMKLFSVQQGTLSNFAWQPGGDLLAFSNDRGDHSFVGLYAPGFPALVWAAPSVDSDAQPAWSPSGRRLAWVRAMVPRANVGYSPFDGNMGNRGPDFAIFVADVKRGEGGSPVVTGAREIFRDDQYGMLNFGYGQRPLLWVDDDTVLFGTEAVSSWAHAVVLDATRPRTVPRELRPGACEDTSWLLGEQGWVYLVSNCAQIDGLGVERVRWTDGARETLSVGADEFSVAGLSSNGYGFTALSSHVAMLVAAYNSPTGVHVMKPGDSVLRPVTADSGFARERFVRPQMRQFKSPDGRFTLHAQLFLPDGNGTAQGRPFPGVVYTHGGSERQMYPAFHYASCYAQEYAANQWLAYQGFAVLSVNYRSGTGYGHGFRVCERCMSQGAAEYQDVREAALQLQGLTGLVDPSRIGIWGLSYGGLNAEQACARDSGLFKACVALAGIFNWVSAERYVTDTGLAVHDADLQPIFLGGFRSLHIGPEPAWAGPGWAARAAAQQSLMLESSPAGHVEGLTSPLLLIHGDADEEVDFQESLGAVRAVRALGRDNVKTMVFPDEAHGLATYAHQLLELQAMGDFLREHLAFAASVERANVLV